MFCEFDRRKLVEALLGVERIMALVETDALGAGGD